MSTNEAPLNVRGLAKRRGSFALENISFSLAPGTITGLIGRNGAGKSTTLNALLGYVHPDAGDIRFFGMDIRKDAGAIRRRIGFVSAGAQFHTRRRLKRITQVTRSFYPDWDEPTYRELLRRFVLDENKTPAMLSNGMKIKYALALALSHGADLLLLDEPTSGLDPVSREELIEIFLQLRAHGRTLLFSTHITSDLEKCADRILYLRRGSLIADMPLDAFRRRWRLIDCPGEIPAALQRCSQGARLSRNGTTVLVEADALASLGMEGRMPELDEIMSHLEKEEDAQ